MLFIPPAYFQPVFYSNGKENKNIGKVKKSVIESMDVNHAPNGWATHTDGTPVQTVLTLQMKEIELVTSVDIKVEGGGN